MGVARINSDGTLDDSLAGMERTSLFLQSSCRGMDGFYRGGFHNYDEVASRECAVESDGDDPTFSPGLV